MRVMIVAETGSCTTAAVAAAAAAVDGDCAHVTVTAVAEPRSAWLALLAIGNSCQVCFPEFSMELELAESEKSLLAARAACCAAAAVPDSLPVCHCVAPDWRSAIRMAGEYDLLVVASLPRRVRDRRLLRRIGHPGLRS